jgi:hypothetical protein
VTPQLQAAFDKVLAVQPARLPPDIQKLLLTPPLRSLDVVLAGDGFALADPAAAPGNAPQALVPKLGIKSWRDGGSLNVIHDGVPLAAALQKILARPTAAQRTLAQAWLQTGQPLQVHLMAYVDFTDISEARFLASPREVRAVSQCLRGASAASVPGLMPRLDAAVKKLVALLPPRSHVIDLACLPDGNLRVVEINPGLGPNDLAALRTLG